MTCLATSLTTLRAIRAAVDAAIVAMDAAVAALVQLTPQAEVAPRVEKPFRAKVPVTRRKLAAKAHRATKAAGPKAAAMTPAKAAPSDGSAATRILHLLAERGGPLKGKEIAALLDLDVETTKRALRQLRDAGQLALSGATSSARWSQTTPGGVS